MYTRFTFEICAVVLLLLLFGWWSCIAWRSRSFLYRIFTCLICLSPHTVLLKIYHAITWTCIEFMCECMRYKHSEPIFYTYSWDCFYCALIACVVLSGPRRNVLWLFILDISNWAFITLYAFDSSFFLLCLVRPILIHMLCACVCMCVWLILFWQIFCHSSYSCVCERVRGRFNAVWCFFFICLFANAQWQYFIFYGIFDVVFYRLKGTLKYAHKPENMSYSPYTQKHSNLSQIYLNQLSSTYSSGEKGARKMYNKTEKKNTLTIIIHDALDVCSTYFFYIEYAMTFHGNIACVVVVVVVVFVYSLQPYVCVFVWIARVSTYAHVYICNICGCISLSLYICYFTTYAAPKRLCI